MSERVIHHFYESRFCAMVALETRLEPFTEATEADGSEVG